MQTKVIDMILYGSDAGSQAVIITQYPQEISQRVIQELERTTTVLPARGAYSGSPTMWCCARCASRNLSG